MAGLFLESFQRWTLVQQQTRLAFSPVYSLRWGHYERDGVSNHQLHDCLLNRLFRRRSKKTPTLRVIGLCAGNSPVTSEFPAQRTSNADNVSIWWPHNVVRAPSVRSQSSWQWFLTQWRLSVTVMLWVALRIPMWHYDDVIMGTMASQITSLNIVYLTVYSDADQRKHQSSASLAFVSGEFPAQMASDAEKNSHLMTSSWIRYL